MFFCDVFFGMERLGDVVVAFRVEARQPVGYLGVVGEEEDEHVVVLLANEPCRFKAVYFRHIHVERHEVGAF